MYCQLDQVGWAAERFGGAGKKMARHKSGNTNIEQKDKNYSRMRLKASSKYKAQLQDQIKEMDLWRYQNEKEEAKRLQGAKKLKKSEAMVWAPPRNQTNWPGWEEASKGEKSAWRLEPEGETEVLEIIIVSDAVEALSWTRMAKAAASRQKKGLLEEKEKHQAKRRRTSKVRKRK